MTEATLAQTADAFAIRLATSADRDIPSAALAPSFPASLEQRYSWMYETNPHGRALTWLAIDRATGRATGCTSVFPRDVLIDGRRRKGSTGGDCFISPEFRRRGIATALHCRTRSSLGSVGVDFMYGPPEVRNPAALLKAGSRLVGQFRHWVRPLSARALERSLGRALGLAPAVSSGPCTSRSE